MIAGVAGRTGSGVGAGGATGAGGAVGAGGDSGGAAAGGASSSGGFDGGGNGPVLQVGVACSSSSQCASGFCVDGVCCVTGCANGCASCNLPIAPGTCIARAAGARPRTPDTCPVELPSSCGRDGTCDGQGGCRLWPEATKCADGRCDGDAVVGEKACNGLGSCLPSATRICTPYRCDPAVGSCRTDCSGNADCPASYCEATGRCHVNITAACVSNDQCASGFCALGVCCNSACDGPCVSCKLPGREGTCAPVGACTVDAATD